MKRAALFPSVLSLPISTLALSSSLVLAFSPTLSPKLLPNFRKLCKTFCALRPACIIVCRALVTLRPELVIFRLVFAIVAAHLLLLAFYSSVLNAKEAAPLVSDEVTEQRLLLIATELRCLVCQNESLASSRADLAEDLRREVRTLIHQGRSDKEIRDFLVARYGDFVLYRPPFKAQTWLLWGGPFLLLLIALWAFFVFVRRRNALPTVLEWNSAKEQKANELLNDRPS